MREDNIKEFCYKLYRLFIVRNSCNTVGITIDRPDKSLISNFCQRISYALNGFFRRKTH